MSDFPDNLRSLLKVSATNVEMIWIQLRRRESVAFSATGPRRSRRQAGPEHPSIILLDDGWMFWL